MKDVWKEYTGWPLNNMEKSYKFLVKHVQLWNVAFHSTSPRWIHSLYLAAVAAYYAKYVKFFIFLDLPCFSFCSATLLQKPRVYRSTGVREVYENLQVGYYMLRYSS